MITSSQLSSTLSREPSQLSLRILDNNSFAFGIPSPEKNSRASENKEYVESTVRKLFSSKITGETSFNALPV